MLRKTLVDMGIMPSDAITIDNQWGNQNEGDWLNGLETVARSCAMKELVAITPKAEPWKTIYTVMQREGDIDKAFSDEILKLDPSVQISVMSIIMPRITDIQQAQQSNGKKKSMKTAEYIKLLSNLGFSFRFNVCTQNIEVNDKSITDEIAKEIRCSVRDAGVREVNVVEDAYGAAAWKNKYNPVKDYLMSTKFDGGNPIEELSNYFTDEYNVFPIFIKRWLIGAVARVMAGAQNRVFILDGKQNMGKSRFSKWLCSPMPEYYYEGSVDPDDKDCKMRLTSVWIWEASEFGSITRKADRERLKAFLTTEIVRERKPYGHYDTQAPAITSFIATANDESGLLSDPTGNRRFMATKLLSIDWEGYTKNVDVEQLWAQAYNLYLEGEPWDLTTDEKLKADAINENYMITDIVEETLLKNFNIDPEDTTNWTSTIQIMEILKDPLKGNLKSNEIDTRKLSSALTKLGIGKPARKLMISGQKLRGYYGIFYQP